MQLQPKARYCAGTATEAGLVSAWLQHSTARVTCRSYSCIRAGLCEALQIQLNCSCSRIAASQYLQAADHKPQVRVKLHGMPASRCQRESLLQLRQHPDTFGLDVNADFTN
jgi:hypothetical protein